MKAFVLLTAMPPTIGHLQLLRFAAQLATDGVVVILCTQPHEPFPAERARALRAAIKHGDLRASLIHFTKTIEQDPATPGFWDMWQQMMKDFGATQDDIIVASEIYGKRLAEITGAAFYPYDIERVLTPIKATRVREEPATHFSDILPEFQPYLRTRITVFGAESTGKTTLSRQLSQELGGQWLFEYARPYLETTVNEITPRSMDAIWHGQRALQQSADLLTNSPYIVQDTDLFSTVGYWQLPHWTSTIGACPSGLISDATRLASDLYIITRSNIPFEQDPLRYGGDKREGNDTYWIDLCKTFNLPYVVLDANRKDERLQEALGFVRKVASAKQALMFYDRHDL